MERRELAPKVIATYHAVIEFVKTVILKKKPAQRNKGNKGWRSRG